MEQKTKKVKLVKRKKRLLNNKQRVIDLEKIILGFKELETVDKIIEKSEQIVDELDEEEDLVKRIELELQLEGLKYVLEDIGYAENNIKDKIQEDLSPTRKLTGIHLKIVSSIAIIWTFFQLWYASPFPFWFDFGMFKGLPARAIHLGFALTLVFLIFPFAKGKKISIFDITISLVAAFCCLYIYFFLLLFQYHLK